jgi:DNA-binding transcriptional LysR family regulator
VDVGARVLSNNPLLNLGFARRGLGLALASPEYVRDFVARGELVPVLEEFSPPFPGFYLYYPQRRHASAALRALVDHLRGARRKARAPNGPGPVRGAHVGR